MEDDHASEHSLLRSTTNDSHAALPPVPRTTTLAAATTTTTVAVTTAAGEEENTRALARDILAARTHGIRTIDIRLNDSGRHRHLIIPARIVEATGRFPGPKHPALGRGLVGHDLRGPPLAVEVLVRVEGRVPVARPLHVRGDGEGPFAHEHGPVARAVVVAGELQVRVLGFGHAGVFDVLVVVVRGQVQVREVLFRVARAPFLVHHHDGELGRGGHVEGAFGGADLGPCGRVVRLAHAVGVGDGVGVLRRVGCAFGFVDQLQHADGRVCRVGVHLIRDPLQPLVGAIVVVVIVEAWAGVQLAGESVRGLSARGAVQDNDNVEAGVFGPADDLVEILLAPLREMFARVDNAFEEPVPGWNAHCI